jgi:hypothetical protein
MQQQPQPVLALNADKKPPFGVVIAVLDDAEGKAA